MCVKLNGKMVYLWRAVDHEGEILESYVTKAKDKGAALIHEEGTEAARQAGGDHHRWAALLRCCNEGVGQHREAGGRTLSQQQRGK